MSTPMNSRSRSHSTSPGKSLVMPSSPLSIRSVEGLKTGSGLQPCAATPTFVLFAQGTSILCLLYDSLALERRFEGHAEDITLIVADNTSEDGVGRIVSVDASKQAIVWDSHTGDELARYNAFEEIKVAAWMKNGNLAFGDSMGNVILFDPLTSESISARTIYDPLCSIAPGADCKTFALGYTNGSVLIAALSPSFIILHTLTTTSLQPSPIATLAWHASSSRQKSDMLATQTRDGDLRVWSVPKSLDAEEGVRVVRILKKPDSNRKGDNWMGWSRNGRIVQYSEGETTVWDVRTKKVTWERVGTLDNVCGITVFGPKGVLFTLGKDDTVQQFALYPPTLLANIQHIPTVPPPSPPVSIEEKKVAEEEQYEGVFQHPFSREEDEYLRATMSPLGRIAHELERLEKMEDETGLGITNLANASPRSRTGSFSTRSSGGTTGKGHQHNVSTTSSKGSQRSSGDQSEFSQTTSVSTGRKNSFGSTGAPMPSPSRFPHPLRQEIHQSPDEAKTATPPRDVDLFAGLRARLASVTYQSPRIGSPKSNMSEDDHRKEMLFCIFGWKGDIEHLIQDQRAFHPMFPRMSAVILRMWLGDLDQNSLSVLLGADFSVPGDWVFLALSAMDGQKSWNHVVRAFVMRLLQKGELHTAVLCLLALGDKSDAVEVYVSHKKYM
ncbi:WD40-repeat-containing domain protein [Tuber brumale]|nr:WD40-repeat-containing domain protein [Tuber brumale]